MIPKECKRLIEVDFPIAEVSRQSAREKSIRHGHPSTLHLWWARRPLAACRAVLMGLLLPDPGDEHCPEDFKTQARQLLPKLVGNVGKSDEDLRAKLLKFIADFSNWDHSAHPTYLQVARGLVKGAHGEEPPLVVDPFAGGGSIPLEALRVGCDAFASDLNPVACLILKVLLEVRRNKACLVLLEGRLDILQATMGKCGDENVECPLTFCGGVIQHADLSVVDLDFASRKSFNAAGAVVRQERWLLGSNEPFEGGIADLAGQIVTFTDDLEGGLGFEGELGIVD